MTRRILTEGQIAIRRQVPRAGQTNEETLAAYLSGTTIEELAELLEIRIPRVYARLHRAMPAGEEGELLRRLIPIIHQVRRHYVTLLEAAQAFGLDRSHLACLCREGRIPGVFRLGEGIGYDWLVPTDGVKFYLLADNRRGSRRTST